MLVQQQWLPALTGRAGARDDARALARRTRERNRARVRKALVEAADTLFERKGFDATTADEIAALAGVSRSSFFRYFATKEAIAFPNAEQRLVDFVDLVQSRLTEMTPFEAVRRSALLVGDSYMKEPELELRRQSIVDGSPTLVVAELDVYRRWETALVEVLNPPDVSATRRRRGVFFAGAACSVIRTALREWYDGGATADLTALGREAFASLECGFSDLEMKG